jgi:hypothetical protein
MAVTAPVRHSVALNGYSLYVPNLQSDWLSIYAALSRYLRSTLIYGRQFEDYLDQICTVGQELHATLIINL